MNKNAEVKKEVKKENSEVKTELRKLDDKPELKEAVEQGYWTPESDTSSEDVSADKVQPREAHWITERSGFTQKSHCSHCGAAAMAIRGANDETLTPFCPMCGYIMK